ncbi:hypothetical protein SAMN04489735_100233 [Aneurinibacillus thermoaerophilus]|uniref:Uncharacterized protein n=1 Tax=Aneurinibacillus thermoaerophilus TaxID=143495 RepID=A0A1G7WP11_ANETH|nr:hypothetical protein [Aneurinibacillus thermoaerophilus]SDG73608.1 hypothetical protein SAMN04489735_100233 [Aneurinibacillus thermoaerophilus]
MVLANFTYLNKVQIHIKYEEDTYYLTTEHAYMINEYKFNNIKDLHNALDNIKYYYLQEYMEENEENPEEHPSHEQMEKLLETLI